MFLFSLPQLSTWIVIFLNFVNRPSIACGEHYNKLIGVFVCNQLEEGEPSLQKSTTSYKLECFNVRQLANYLEQRKPNKLCISCWSPLEWSCWSTIDHRLTCHCTPRNQGSSSTCSHDSRSPWTSAWDGVLNVLGSVLKDGTTCPTYEIKELNVKQCWMTDK